MWVPIITDRNSGMARLRQTLPISTSVGKSIVSAHKVTISINLVELHSPLLIKLYFTQFALMIL